MRDLQVFDSDDLLQECPKCGSEPDGDEPNWGVKWLEAAPTKPDSVAAPYPERMEVFCLRCGFNYWRAPMDTPLEDLRVA